MEPTKKVPITKSFDLGPNGFISNWDFILAEGDWNSVNNYVLAVLDNSSEQISFPDVTSFIENLKSQASTWQDKTFSSVVSLASSVFEYASSKVPVYFKGLDKVLSQLGDNPSNSQLLVEVNAILESIIPATQEKEVSTIVPTVQDFEKNAIDEEIKLRAVFIYYISIYLVEAPFLKNSVPKLPSGLTESIEKLSAAWQNLTNELTNLKDWVNENAKNDTKFQAQLSLDHTITAWNTVSEAANKWRINAYRKE